MKESQRIASALVLCVGLILGLDLVFAQTKSEPEQIVGLQLVTPEEALSGSTFWFFQKMDSEPPLPFNPFPKLPVYLLGDGSGSFLVDDSSVNYVTLREDVEAHLALKKLEGQYGLETPEVPELGIYGVGGGGMMLMSGPPPFDEEGEGGGGGGSTNYVPMAYSYGSNVLWLEITTVSNDLAYLIIHGTVPDVTYELLSKEALTNAVWAGEGVVVGAANQDWTPTMVAVGTRTNSLFLRVKSWVDADGDGLPDWWELENGLDPNNPDTGNTGISDGYKNPAGDGWNNLYKYQHGMNPNQFYTPPPPKVVFARLNSTGTNVVITWQSGGGPVQSYTIEDYYGDPLGSVGNSTFSFTDAPDFDFYGSVFDTPAYRVVADFGGGVTAASSYAYVRRTGMMADSKVVRDSTGHFSLALSSPPQNLGGVRLSFFYFDSHVFSFVNTWFDLAASSFTNGVISLSDQQLITNYYTAGAYMQATNAPAGDISSMGNAGPDYDETAPAAGFANSFWSHGTLINYTNPIAFVNAATQLKENLKFLLRAATITQPFSFISDIGSPYSTTFPVWGNPPGWFARYGPSTAYEYSGFRAYSPGSDHLVMRELRSVQENLLFRNFAYNTVDFSNNTFVTGADYDYTSGVLTRTLANVKYLYSGSGQTPLPLALSTTNTTWLYAGVGGSSAGGVLNAEVGIGFNGTRYFLSNNMHNCFGLAINSARIARTNLLLPGIPTTVVNLGGSCFLEVTNPQLHTVAYYFASQTPYFNHSGTPPPPLPGTPDFTVTNTSPLLITPFGREFTVSGWAKQAITNGYANKFGYLEQYFDKAYKTGTNGAATTNQTGILSPYGEFFPTEPGRMALVTMPDIDTGQRGTGVVNVIKLQLDVNHDGVMDLTYAGQDNTSLYRPFKFWINNDRDEPGSGGSLDRDISLQPDANNADYSFGEIRSQRNLEDFARLWICGVPSLPSSNGYTATLKLNALSATPTAINLYLAYETNGGIAYLTNLVTASNTVADANYNTAFSPIESGYEYVLPPNFFDGTNKYFLFEGASNGFGELALTIYQGTNVLARASAFIDLHDIKDFYERATVTNVLQNWPQMVQTNLTSGFQVNYSPPYDPTEPKELAVFVHGWRMPEWEAQNFAETMFKRLYWQGFQGRFAALRWPTRSKETESFEGMDYITYNRSEYIAFKSGKGAAAYLNDLRNRYTNYTISVSAHSMGGIVAMQTLKELVSSGLKPLDNLVLMQAAVPSHCFDSNVVNYQAFLDAEAVVHTPDVYRSYGAGITNALRTGGKIANFFNPLDFALFAWELNQTFYVTNFLGYGFAGIKPNTFLGYYTDGTNSVLRTNALNQSGLAVLYGGSYTNGPTRSITDVHELMPFIARPRSQAVGEQASVAGQIQGPQLNLQTQLGFGLTPSDHSGQFNRNVQESQVRLFYFQLRTNLFIQP